ncbi:TIR-like protein FxsC [Streptomyces spongiae]|uniref:Toll/interleukin-1 receptor domain-containing protein n=1 Tax=Streptomyces spongiae TaxID=565072 RepID=A0A5N8XBY2_9ACTN|nr:TIR-like protein FxsC [Streptomyces spongiae]MPY56897.1 toll/interleukin-1 receptor domain-containing protein [Streptomyces spongiae]
MRERSDDNRPRRSVQQPYGFLSYGRTPHVPESDRPPDELLRHFHAKLTGDLMELTDLDAKIPAVYLDERMPLGTLWEDELKGHLARCQVLVPLLSQRLFSSDWCALEWQCFELRQELQRERGTFTRNAIVPVLWNPLRPEEIPPPYRDVQYTHQAFGTAYADMGLRGLLKYGRHATFTKVVYQLALKIVEVAVSARLEPCEPGDFDHLFDSLKRSTGEEH